MFSLKELTDVVYKFGQKVISKLAEMVMMVKRM